MATTSFPMPLSRRCDFWTGRTISTLRREARCEDGRNALPSCAGCSHERSTDGSWKRESRPGRGGGPESTERWGASGEGGAESIKSWCSCRVGGWLVLRWGYEVQKSSVGREAENAPALLRQSHPWTQRNARVCCDSVLAEVGKRSTRTLASQVPTSSSRLVTNCRCLAQKHDPPRESQNPHPTCEETSTSSVVASPCTATLRSSSRAAPTSTGTVGPSPPVLPASEAAVPVPLARRSRSLVATRRSRCTSACASSCPMRTFEAAGSRGLVAESLPPPLPAPPPPLTVANAS